MWEGKVKCARGDRVRSNEVAKRATRNASEVIDLAPVLRGLHYSIRCDAATSEMTGHMDTARDKVVAVAMSGGVDSTAAALCFRAEGSQVTGLTALLATHAGSEGSARKAEEVCRHLGIGHHTLDLRADFDRLVIQPFVEEYARGRTPNPCVRCNERVKFGLLCEYAREMGAEALATGHYARTCLHTDGSHSRVCLLRAGNLHKDQSYVLHHLSQEQLSFARFPLGEMTKDQARELVAEAGIAIAPSEESQDICFLEGLHFDELLRERVPTAFRPGEIVDLEGTVLGHHDGVAQYTVGQRKGLRLGGSGGRRFVLRLEPEANRVVVGQDAEVWVHSCEVDQVSLICVPEAGAADPRSRLPLTLDCEVMVRYNGTLTHAQVTIDGDSAQVRFARLARAPTPGQSAVFYRGDCCLGGGVISSTELTKARC